MSNKTLQVAKTIEAFHYDSSNDPVRLDSDMLGSRSIINDKLVHDEITINGTAVELGGSINIHGGSGPPANQSQIDFAITPSTVELGSGNQIVQIGPVTVTSGYTINSVNIQVRDQSNALIHTQTTNAAFSVNIPRSPRGTAHVSASAQVTRTSDNVTYGDSRTKTIAIEAAWYAGRRSTAPTALTDLSRQGIWEGDTNFVGPTGTDTLYIALPTRSGGYDMRDGVFRLFIPNDGTTFATDWTLYSTTEARAGVTYRIEEA